MILPSLVVNEKLVCVGRFPNMSYLISISLAKTLPCLAEPGKIIVIGKPNRSLDEVIPYLATLPGVIAYNPDTLTLTFRRPHGCMTLYPEKVYITQIKDSEEGLELLKALAAALLQQTRLLTECLPLVSDPAFGDRRATLEAML